MSTKRSVSSVATLTSSWYASFAVTGANANAQPDASTRAIPAREATRSAAAVPIGRERTRGALRIAFASLGVLTEVSVMHVPTSMLAANAATDPDSKHAEAYRFVRERIVSLELAPASLLDEQALADAIGVGLTPVRQALRRLAWESLVVILPRRGTMVADLHPADIENIFEMRLDLESLAAELAAGRASTAELAHLETLMERTRAELATGGTPDSLIALDRETHGALWAAAGQRAAGAHARLALRARDAALELRAAAHRGHPGADRRPPRDRRGRPRPRRRHRRAAACTSTSRASSSRSAPPGAASAPRTSPTAPPPQEPRLAPWP